MPVPGSLSAVHLALGTMSAQYRSLDGVALAKAPSDALATGPLPPAAGIQHNLAPAAHQLPNGSHGMSASGAESAVAFSATESSKNDMPGKPQKPLGEVLKDAGKKALGGGLPGAVAMTAQVLSLMWLRTTVNYQYRYGTDTTTALRTLYREGGVARFYRGLGPALLQGPLSRFGDTASNAGTLALLDSNPTTAAMPIGAKTAVASAAAGLFRIALMPIDTLKTIMQVEGQSGMSALSAKVRAKGPGVLYHGALAASAATFVGHYPWFATYNYLNALLPRYEDDLLRKLGRSAVIGFSSSFISDCCSNSIRVIKTTKQTSKEAVTYMQVAQSIIAQDGVLGLMGRGLKTKILANGLQGIMFSVCWRLGQDWWAHHVEGTTPAASTTATAAVTAKAGVTAASTATTTADDIAAEAANRQHESRASSADHSGGGKTNTSVIGRIHLTGALLLPPNVHVYTQPHAHPPADEDDDLIDEADSDYGTSADARAAAAAASMSGAPAS